MKINVKEEVVLEREIDIEDLLCVLKHESETENCTVRVDKNLLKDAALVIEKLLSNPEYDANAELVEENKKLKSQCEDLIELNESVLKTNSELLEGCKKSFNDSMDVNRNLTDENERLRKANEEWLDISEAIIKTNEELLGKVKELEAEKEMLKKMLSRKYPYEPPKVNLDKTKEAKDKVEMVKLRTPDIYNGWDMEIMDALAGILLHGLAL